jgi:hypothetical protein
LWKGGRDAGSTDRNGHRVRLQSNLLYLAGREPVGIVCVFQTGIALGTVFGWWHWTPEETGAVTALVAAALAFVRGIVTPPQPKRGGGRAE